MSKRDKTIRVFCGHEGCHEMGFYSYENRKEYIELESKYGNSKWRCVRHTHPEDVLSIDNPITQKTVISGKSKRYPELKELFWDDDFVLWDTTGNEHKKYRKSLFDYENVVING